MWNTNKINQFYWNSIKEKNQALQLEMSIFDVFSRKLVCILRPKVILMNYINWKKEKII